VGEAWLYKNELVKSKEVLQGQKEEDILEVFINGIILHLVIEEYESILLVLPKYIGWIFT
jgi:hypothetical protein